MNHDQVIPKNDQIQRQIENWEKKDKMFVCTRASDYVIECLQNNRCLTLTAPSGVGKSFIARHTALLLKKEGYNIIPVYLPTDIRDYYQPGKKTVFIVDDVCGNFTANQQQIDKWKQLLPVINTIIADKYCKIIVSCRLQVFMDDKFNILLPFKNCECNLISDKLCLTSVEKNMIANTYIDSRLQGINELSQSCEFFPLLCSIYNGEGNGDVREFFKNPFNVYQNELDHLTRHGDEGILRICSLALCVIFNNQLEEKWLMGKFSDEQKHIIEDICDACGSNIITSKAKLKKTLDTLDGTFICKHDGIYRTKHDKLFDFLAHYFGQNIIECLIDHGDSGLVHERFIWKKSLDYKNRNLDFIIEIPDDYLESYLKRFIKDWLGGKVSCVFSNTAMKVSSFRQQLVQYLLQLNKSQQVMLASTKDTVIPKESCASGSTPLIWNCYYGYTDIVPWMLHNDIDVDQYTDGGINGLIMASQEGHTDIVKLLLENDPNVDLCNNDGCSPLYIASRDGYTDIVKLLLEKNPQVDLCSKDGSSPLSKACIKGHTDIVKLLLENDPNVDLCNNDGWSPLYIASRDGHTDIVKLLLEKNPRVDLCNKEGYFPLSKACFRGHTDIVKLLLEKDPNVDLCDRDGFTPLISACIFNSTSIVQMLIKHKPNINAQSFDGGNALLFSAYKGNIETTQLLLKNNADCNICAYSKQHVIDTLPKYPWITLDKLKQSTFDCLIKDASPHVADYVSRKSVDYVFDVEAGCSPLHFACYMGWKEVVRCLLDHNANINLTKEDGTTPLYFACEVGHEDIVRFLLDNGSNTQICRLDGKSSLQIATDNGHKSIALMVTKHMLKEMKLSS